MTGTFTDWATCHTILNAIGFTAGPDKPPVIVESTGRLRSASTAIPNRVLIKDMLSAPALSTARAISVISVTLGDSLTMRLFLYTERTAFTTSSAP